MFLSFQGIFHNYSINLFAFIEQTSENVPPFFQTLQIENAHKKRQMEMFLLSNSWMRRQTKKCYILSLNGRYDTLSLLLTQNQADILLEREIKLCVTVLQHNLPPPLLLFLRLLLTFRSDVPRGPQAPPPPHLHQQYQPGGAGGSEQGQPES